MATGFGVLPPTGAALSGVGLPGADRQAAAAAAVAYAFGAGVDYATVATGGTLQAPLQPTRSDPSPLPLSNSPGFSTNGLSALAAAGQRPGTSRA